MLLKEVLRLEERRHFGLVLRFLCYLVIVSILLSILLSHLVMWHVHI